MNKRRAEVIWLIRQMASLLIDFCICAKAELLLTLYTGFVNDCESQRENSKTVQLLYEWGQLSMAKTSGQHLLRGSPSKLLDDKRADCCICQTCRCECKTTFVSTTGSTGNQAREGSFPQHSRVLLMFIKGLLTGVVLDAFSAHLFWPCPISEHGRY